MPHHFELLEKRRLLSTLLINGTGGNDSISLRISDSDYVYTVNGESMTIPLAGVTSIVIDAAGGADTIQIESLAHPTTVLGGSGNDQISFAAEEQRISAIAAAVVVDGGSDDDILYIHDWKNFSNNTHTLTATGYTAASGASIAYTSLLEIHLRSGEGLDSINVEDTPTNAAIFIRPNRGFDQININETSAGSFVALDNTNNTGTSDQLNVNADGAGSANVILDTSFNFSSLTIGSSGRVSLQQGGNRLVRTRNLDITGSGVLDLTDNAMIYMPNGDPPTGMLNALLASGYNAGAWNGAGIISSSAAGKPQFGLGLALGSDLFTTFPSWFEGVSVYASDVLIKYTLSGDADLNERVNLADFNRLAGNFAQTGRRWSQGDFNYDGASNLADFNLLAGNFGRQLSPTGAVFGRKAAFVPHGHAKRIAEEVLR